AGDVGVALAADLGAVDCGAVGAAYHAALQAGDSVVSAAGGDVSRDAGIAGDFAGLQSGFDSISSGAGVGAPSRWTGGDDLCLALHLLIMPSTKRDVRVFRYDP